MTHLLSWMIPMMADYCNLFEMDCNRSGCGIDDHCDEGEVCEQRPDHEKSGYECISPSKRPFWVNPYERYTVASGYSDTL